MGLLETMELLSNVTVLLGLVFNIVVILFIVISVLLIYSLLMISVETKSFENGVLRLVGLSKSDCVQMILIQSITFVLPSIIVGYSLSVPCLHYLYGYLFSSSPGIQISSVPTAYATFLAVFLGLFIPMLSSIVPIRIALSKNLNEVLNANRSKTKGVVVTEVGKNAHVGSYLIFGSISVIAGIGIYYLLPVAILNSNLGLLLNIFFSILLGMILGLTMIALNLQKMLEIFLVNTLLFFEKRSMK